MGLEVAETNGAFEPEAGAYDAASRAHEHGDGHSHDHAHPNDDHGHHRREL
jgi:urease accessory protein